MREGADMLMVKPGLPYLDIVRQVKDKVRIAESRKPTVCVLFLRNACNSSQDSMQVEAIRPIEACAIITDSWLLACALSFLNAERQARKQQVPFLKSLLMTRPRFKPLTLQTRSSRSHHYATESGKD